MHLLTLPNELLYIIFQHVPLWKARWVLAHPRARRYYRHAQQVLDLSDGKEADMQVVRGLLRQQTLTLPFVHTAYVKHERPEILNRIAMPRLQTLHITLLYQISKRLLRYIAQVPTLQYVYIGDCVGTLHVKSNMADLAHDLWGPAYQRKAFIFSDKADVDVQWAMLCFFWFVDALTFESVTGYRLERIYVFFQQHMQPNDTLHIEWHPIGDNDVIHCERVCGKAYPTLWYYRDNYHATFRLERKDTAQTE